jgi:histidine ammonia-lyase
LIHFIRPHKGQITTASRKRISGRKWNYRAREDTQDPYSFVAFHKFMALQRCNWHKKVFKTEINSVTDNPNIYRKSKLSPEVIFTDNHWHWHWTYSNALAELEVFQKEEPINWFGLRNLPAFLVDNLV